MKVLRFKKDDRTRDQRIDEELIDKERADILKKIAIEAESRLDLERLSSIALRDDDSDEFPY